jgi:hypothetical protein
MRGHSLHRNRSKKHEPAEAPVAQVKSYHEKRVSHIITTFLYRCPHTNDQVQAWTDGPPVADDLEAYQSVKCLACMQLHWVNPRTGRVLESIRKRNTTPWW